MMNMKAEFIRLIDHAISCSDLLAKSVKDTDKSWMAEDAITAKDQFQRIKDDALDDKLLPSKGAGLGITRALGEWAPDEMYAAGKAVEDFFRANWK